METKQKMDLAAWWAAWREYFTLKATAVFFKVSERTVARWLAGGLDEHRMFAEGFQTAVKEWNWREGAHVWGIHPLGVVHWLASRAAERGRDADLPGPVRLLADSKRWLCAWEAMQERKPEKYAGPCPPFSWRRLADDFSLFHVAVILGWVADGMEPKGESDDLVGGPFGVGVETPDAWFERLEADAARENPEAEGEDSTPGGEVLPENQTTGTTGNAILRARIGFPTMKKGNQP